MMRRKIAKHFKHWSAWWRIQNLSRDACITGHHAHPLSYLEAVCIATSWHVFRMVGVIQQPGDHGAVRQHCYTLCYRTTQITKLKAQKQVSECHSVLLRKTSFSAHPRILHMFCNILEIPTSPLLWMQKERSSQRLIIYQQGMCRNKRESAIYLDNPKEQYKFL